MHCAVKGLQPRQLPGPKRRNHQHSLTITHCTEYSTEMTVGYIFTSRGLRFPERCFEELADQLGTVPTETALQFLHELAKINFWTTSHGGWNRPDADTPGFINEYLPSEPRNYHRFALAAARKADFESPVCNHGLLGFAAMVSLFCSKNESIPLNQALRRRLFVIVLHIQNHLLDEYKSPKDIPKVLPSLIRHMTLELRLQRKWECELGRLHGLVSLPEAETRLRAKFPEQTTDSFFRDSCGLTGKEYQVAANVIFGAIMHEADFDRLPEAAPHLNRIVQPLLKYSTSDIAAIGTDLGCVNSYEQLAQQTVKLLAHPSIQFRARHYVFSFDALFNRLIRDLPYIGFESRTIGPIASKSQAARYFGSLFEGYVVWLLRRFFQEPIHIYSPYYDHQNCERDFAISIGGHFLIFEVKSGGVSEAQLLASRPIDYVESLRGVTKQVFSGAKSLVEGTALDFQRKPVPAAHSVVPCCITFEPIPFREPYSHELEGRLEFILNQDVFHERNGILPVQFIDIQEIEMFDNFFDLPSDRIQLANALLKRARNRDARNTPFSRLMFDAELPVRERTMLKQLTEEAEGSTAQYLKEVSKAS